MTLQLLPCNQVEFALARIQKASEEIQQANNKLWHPAQQQLLIELVNSMADSLENTAKWAEHLQKQQSNLRGK